ncbi:unnamed protein product [Discula destructiva]
MAPLWQVFAASLLASSCLTLAYSSPRSELREIGRSVAERADASPTGYLGAFFLGAAPDVYFYSSQGNNAIAFSALNGGKPILEPTVGTGGVRDPSIVAGGGSEAGNKWYIVGTDLDISKTTWGLAVQNGSRGIIVWESTDLINWTGERLVIVEDETAGMVWAPGALFDASKDQYFVYWSSKFYEASDTAHSGTPSNTMIRYAYTSDFKTFTAPQTYIDYAPTDIIDLTILPYPKDASAFLRFMKDETLKHVFVEYSTTGLFGEWTRPGGNGAYIRNQTEGPAAYWDNTVDGQVHLLLDYYSGNGNLVPLVSTDPKSNSGWEASSAVNFPSGLRHGSVLPVNATLLSALEAAWA